MARHFILIIVYIITGFLIPICEATAKDEILSDDRQVFVDWVPEPPGQSVCQGHYVLPHFTPEQQAESVIEADSGGLLLNEGPLS